MKLQSSKTLRCFLIASVVVCLALLYGCETLEPVKPAPSSAQPETQTATGQETVPSKGGSSASRKQKSSLKNLARRMDSGAKPPNVNPPETPAPAPAPAPTQTAAAAAAPKGAETIPIPPEVDAPLCANINDILEKYPIDEKADILSRPIGKISAGRVVLMQANGDIKPHYHSYHDEILYIVKGKGILMIGEDRNVASPGAVFIIPKRATISLQNTGEKPFVAVVIEIPAADPKDITMVKGN